jgi:hypothetical protein
MYEEWRCSSTLHPWGKSPLSLRYEAGRVGPRVGLDVVELGLFMCIYLVVIVPNANVVYSME